MTEDGQTAHDRSMEDDVDPREAARIRRRDRDIDAEARELMRPGMGKVFKQIQDAQRRAADADSAPEHEARPTRPAVRRRPATKKR